jgi:hypothetical protein
MRFLLVLLAVVLLIPAQPAVAGSSPKKSADGSLVLGDARSAAGSEDTLYELQAREVQAYITRSRTFIWPRTLAGRPMPTVWRTYPWRPFSNRPLSNPQLEGLIHKYANFYGVDPGLVRAVMRHESGFNPQAVSPKGAQGLMQLMPGTAALMGVGNPFDAEQNIAGGVGYLRHCLDRFQHNVPLALAAYNAGPESVTRCGTIPPYAETQLFVHNVMGTYTGGGLPRGLGKADSPAPKGVSRSLLKQAPTREQLVKRAPRPRAKIIEVKPTKGKSSLANGRIIEVRSPRSPQSRATVKD